MPLCCNARMNAKDMKPKEIVEFLNDYVIGQKEAKKIIAIALRNRWRRMQLSPEMQDDIMPKNILMHQTISNMQQKQYLK